MTVSIADSIFLTIKKVLGIDSSYTGFDNEILLGINNAIMNLNQLGVGPEEGLIVTDSSQTWSQLIGSSKKLEGVKTYIQLKTRLVFDPPSSSFVLDAINQQIQVLEYRLNRQAEFDESQSTS